MHTAFSTARLRPPRAPQLPSRRRRLSNIAAPPPEVMFNSASGLTSL